MTRRHKAKVKLTKSNIAGYPYNLTWDKLVDNYGLICYLAVILLASGLFISSLFIGGVTWDEVYAIPMIQTHFNTAFNNLPLNQDPGTQPLIYYGILQLLPGYLLSLIFNAYHTCSHITVFLMSLLTSYYVYKIMRLFGIQRNISFITAALLLLYPIWLGHSFFNDKDLPAGAFFTIFSYYVCKVILTIQSDKNISLKLYLKLIICGAILAGVKFAFFPVIVTDLFLITLFYKDTILVRRLWFLGKTIILTLVLTLVVTPGAWHQPVTYMINDVELMGKFNWYGCVALFGRCVVANSPQWNAGIYLISWYLAQIPLVFLLSFFSGIIYIVRLYSGPININKQMCLILLIQLFLIPVLAVLHNSVFYDGTRHTLFCLPIIVIISGFGIEYVLMVSNKWFKYTGIIILILCTAVMTIDNIRLTPYQYIYFNEISRSHVNYKNTDFDYWGFSLRETFNNIDMMKFYTPYISLEHGPMPVTLIPFMHGEYKFVQYDKNISLPNNIHINVLGLLRHREQVDERIDPVRCQLAAYTSRYLLFKDDPLVLSMDFYCN